MNNVLWIINIWIKYITSFNELSNLSNTFRLPVDLWGVKLS